MGLVYIMCQDVAPVPTRYEPFSGPCAIAEPSKGARLTMHTQSLFIALARFICMPCHVG